MVDRSVVSFRISFGLRESPERSRGLYAIIRATQTQVHEHRRRRNCDRTESEFIDIRMEWESLHKSLFRRTNRLTLVVCWWDTLCVVLAALLSLPVPTTTIYPCRCYYAFVGNRGTLTLLQIASSAAKKLWEKGEKLPSGNNGPLPPLQLHGGPDNQVWRDSTWSTQGELMTPRRSFPVDSNSGGILR